MKQGERRRIFVKAKLCERGNMGLKWTRTDELAFGRTVLGVGQSRLLLGGELLGERESQATLELSEGGRDVRRPCHRPYRVERWEGLRERGSRWC